MNQTRGAHQGTARKRLKERDTMPSLCRYASVSVSTHARVGASENKEETTEGESNDAVVASLGSLSNGDSGTEEEA